MLDLLGDATIASVEAWATHVIMTSCRRFSVSDVRLLLLLTNQLLQC